MKSIFTAVLSALVLMGAPTTSAFAKGQTVKLAVSGPGIPQTIEITEREAIAPSVWGNAFFDVAKGPLAAPDAALPRYVVKFYVQPPQGGAVEMKYALYLVLDTATERALVYLPAPSDELYRLNTAMRRNGQEGKWYAAAEKWGRAVQTAVAPR